MTKKWELQKCRECSGKGEIIVSKNTGYTCTTCKGTGYTGLIIYDSVCAALFLSKGCCNKQGLLSVSKDVEENVAFLIEDTDGCQYIRDSIFVTLDQLRETIEYQAEEPWVKVDHKGLSFLFVGGHPSKSSACWHKNIAILADNVEQAREIINACGGNG